MGLDRKTDYAERAPTLTLPREERERGPTDVWAKANGKIFSIEFVRGYDQSIDPARCAPSPALRGGGLGWGSLGIGTATALPTTPPQRFIQGTL
jgi:hypothetical protein